MQPSGQTKPQLEQPVQLSGLSMYEYVYPFVLTSFDIARTSNGQDLTHMSQPLHRSTSTTIAPLIFAIIYFVIKYHSSKNSP